ncbi:hypothetical protein L596_000892 [Steinernema carpocapsae]|uniref:Uncharacterized protein n=1 Tax=Steinernema carpocapsae TaxID=34508 RepID=A0A4U8UK10_STECR|nr:hypothetical protein L596_000892 [Steinernema carpocapsae]
MASSAMCEKRNPGNVSSLEMVGLSFNLVNVLLTLKMQRKGFWKDEKQKINTDSGGIEPLSSVALDYSNSHIKHKLFA